MTARDTPVRTHSAWHTGSDATRSPPASAGGFLVPFARVKPASPQEAVGVDRVNPWRSLRSTKPRRAVDGHGGLCPRTAGRLWNKSARAGCEECRPWGCREGCPCPESRRRWPAEAWMPQRRHLRANGAQDGRSERPATGHGQPRPSQDVASTSGNPCAERDCHGGLCPRTASDEAASSATSVSRGRPRAGRSSHAIALLRPMRRPP